MRILRTLITCISLAAFAFAGVAGAQSTNTGASATPDFARGGILDCVSSYTGGSSVGQSSASGVYVPVNDAAVTINTFLLLRKECIIKEFLNQVKNHVIANESRKVLTAAQTGRGGNPLYVQDIGTELNRADQRAALDFFQSNYVSAVDPRYRSTVERNLARGYSNSINRPRNELGCERGGTGFWDEISSYITPGCDAFSAYLIAKAHFDAIRAQAVYECEQQWLWGRGYYPLTNDPNYPCRDVGTPAVDIQGSTAQALGAGFELQKAADDVGEMVGSLFTSVTAQALTDNRGLAGLLERNGDLPSYLDRVVAAAREGVVTAVGNSAISVLQAALIHEDSYQKALRAISTVLANTVSELRRAEEQCFALVVAEVCQSAPDANGRCTEKVVCTTTTDPVTKEVTQTCPTPRALVIEKERYPFAQRLIDTKTISELGMSIKEYVDTVLTPNFEKSSTTMAQLRALADRIVNPTQQGDPQAAFGDVDKLATANPPVLKDGQDVVRAQETEKEIAGVMTELLEDTAFGDGAEWTDSATPSIGWCNVSGGNPNKSTLIEEWKKCFVQGSTSCIFPRNAATSSAPTS